MHKISDDFEFRPDQTTDYRVSCPSTSKKIPKTYNGKWCLHASSFSFELIMLTRTGIKARISFISVRIRPLTLTLFALEWRNFHMFELEFLGSQLANLYQSLCVASSGWRKGCIRSWRRLDKNAGFRGKRKPQLTFNWQKWSPPFLICFSSYHFYTCR